MNVNVGVGHVGEHSPNTICHIAGCGLIKGPDEESINIVSDP